MENNFWWDTTDSGISSLIEGPNEHTPWEYDFIPGVPGEPVSIDSVRNYDSSYSHVIDSIFDDPDTLYLRIYGQDRLASMREAAVAIIKSSVYPGGIAVALVESDTNSGIYEGKAIVKTSTGNDTIRIDDIYQIVRVDSVCDSLQIIANIDTTQKFMVYHRECPGVEEKSNIKSQSTKLFQNYPNPFSEKAVIRYSLNGNHNGYTINASLRIYDLAGRLVNTLVDGNQKAGYYEVNWNGRDNLGKRVGSGVYFYRLEADNYTEVKNMFLIKE